MIDLIRNMISSCRHISKLEAELETYRASSSHTSVIDLPDNLTVNVAEVVPVLPFDATLQQQAVFHARVAVERVKHFFTEQPWGQAQILAIYVVLLHYYALFYKRSCL